MWTTFGTQNLGYTFCTTWYNLYTTSISISVIFFCLLPACFSSFEHFINLDIISLDVNINMNGEEFMKIWANVPVLSQMSSWQKMASHLLFLEEEQSSNIDHRRLPRSARRFFRHSRARTCIKQDYLGPMPLFNGREFELMWSFDGS